MKMRLAFVGFGNVARAFARQLDSRAKMLADELGVTWQTTAIATANHGCVVSDEGLNLDKAIKMAELGESLVALKGATACLDSMDVIKRCNADLLFETTPLDPQAGEPAVSHIRNALKRKIHVVTANKGPVAFAFKELKALAIEQGAHFRFESSVMDGAPVFNLAEYCLPAAKITALSGVLNSTTNMILSGMESGRPFDESLDEARRLGIAEANSDYDLDGWDTAVKMIALVQVLMGIDVRLAEVDRTGIRDITPDVLQSAAQKGSVVRLMARAEKAAGGVKIKVAPENVPLTSPFGSVRGTSSLLVIKSDLMGEIGIYEEAPGIEQTAYGLLSDMMRICEELKRP